MMNCQIPTNDRYCETSFNPVTGQEERDWIKYADGVFEPVRKTGKLSQKWNDRRTDYAWWVVKKPADWHPHDEGGRFSWNHHHGEEHKPADWGNRSEHENNAGEAPFYMGIELDKNNRIGRRTERIDGRRETWEFSYDEAGRLIGCFSDTGWGQEFEYDGQARRSADYAVGRKPLMRRFLYGEDNRLLSAGSATYEHDENGFRTARIENDEITRYAYSPDYRLLGAELPDGRTISYQHDEGGMRRQKAVDGIITERYHWLDFTRLEAFEDKDHTWQFHYAKGDRVPLHATIDGTLCRLYFDQCGTLKVIVDDTGNVIKATQYGPFGDLLWDSNPALRTPLGFAGGLHDPDLGLTRFGWRDYDPATARWTAPDPMGDAGGDNDWYGYCLDDPVNMIDSLGLFFDEVMDAISGFMDGLGGFFGGGDDEDTGDKPTETNSQPPKAAGEARKRPLRQIRGTANDFMRELRAKDQRERQAEEAASQERIRAMDEEAARNKRSVFEKYAANFERLGGAAEPLGGPAETLGSSTTQKASPQLASETTTEDVSMNKASQTAEDQKENRRRAATPKPTPATQEKQATATPKPKQSFTATPFLDTKQQIQRLNLDLTDIENDVADISVKVGSDIDKLNAADTATTKQTDIENDLADISVNNVSDITKLNAADRAITKQYEEDNTYTGQKTYTAADLNEARDRMWSGVWDALTLGVSGALTAFGEVGKAFMTNDQFRTYTIGALTAGLTPIALATAAPLAAPLAASVKTSAATAATTAAAAIRANQANLLNAAPVATDFASGLLVPGPPPVSAPGYTGYSIREAYDYITD